MAKLRAKPCECGSVRLRVNNSQVAEDAMSSWVSCMSCGAMGDYTDDAYSDPEGAVYLWNTYPHTQHPAEALAARSPSQPASGEALPHAEKPASAHPIQSSTGQTEEDGTHAS